jgi:hypothetical protein
MFNPIDGQGLIDNLMWAKESMNQPSRIFADTINELIAMNNKHTLVIDKLIKNTNNLTDRVNRLEKKLRSNNATR